MRHILSVGRLSTPRHSRALEVISSAPAIASKVVDRTSYLSNNEVGMASVQPVAKVWGLQCMQALRHTARATKSRFSIAREILPLQVQEHAYLNNACRAQSAVANPVRQSPQPYTTLGGTRHAETLSRRRKREGPPPERNVRI